MENPILYRVSWSADGGQYTRCFCTESDRAKFVSFISGLKTYSGIHLW